MNRTRAFFPKSGHFSIFEKRQLWTPSFPHKLRNCAFHKIFSLYHFLYQNIFLFSQSKLVFMKICFHYATFISLYQNIFLFFIKINLYSIRNIFIKHISFHSSKIFFYYMNFSFNISLVSISSFPFVLTKVRILLSACKLNSSTRV